MKEQVLFQLNNETNEDENAHWADANVSSAERFAAKMAKDERVLDLGTGTGVALATLHKLGFFSLTGFDASALKLERARAKVSGASLVCGDAHEMPFLDNDFAGVHSRHVLEHMYDPVIVLEEVRRILSPGGFFYVTVPLPDNPAEAPAHVGADVLGTSGAASPDAFLAVLKAAGFDVIEHTCAEGPHGGEARVWAMKPQK